MAYVTAAVAKARDTTLADFSDTYVNDCVAEFEALAEEYCDRAFTSRTVTEYVTERPLCSTVHLDHPEVTAVSAITSDGVSVSTTNVIINRARGILECVPWAGTVPLVATVTYTYGPASVPKDIARACIVYVSRTLNGEASGTSSDVRWQGPDGAVSFVRADWANGRPTRWDDVNDILNRYRPTVRRPLVG
jgi:hypothetical protein